MRGSFFSGARAAGVLCLVGLAAVCAFAQEAAHVSSPNGLLEFRLMVAEPTPGALQHLAYQVSFKGERVLDTSYLGILVHDQEPVLCENVALVRSTPHDGPGYHGMLAEYLQNGTVGRRVNIEARVYDDGVAFRYLIPPTAALLDLLIEDEQTEFSFVQAVATPGPVTLPFVQQAGAIWVGIFESAVASYPPAKLVRSDETTMITRLVQPDRIPRVAFDGHTPFTGPWRVIALAPEREGVAKTQVVRETK